MRSSLVIGSRGSKLALAQAELIAVELRRINPEVELRLEIIKTTGDVRMDPLSAIGGKGVFTKELEDALLDKRIDVAVHSLKDLPSAIPAGLEITAICKREDARDALVLGRGFNYPQPSIRHLRSGAVVGTSSPRRTAQLKFLRPDLVIKDIRGNIDTRLRKLDEGQYEALVLAFAGLHRLSLEERISYIVPAMEILPAVGQGAIALETRSEDDWANELLAPADDRDTRLACTAERAFQKTLGGGCNLPIAAHAVVEGKQVRIDGLVTDPAGSSMVRDQLTGSTEEVEMLGTRLARRLMGRGAHLLE